MPADEYGFGKDQSTGFAADRRKIGRGTDPFAAAVRASRMPMIIPDPRQNDNPVVSANASFCRLTGYEREEILGENCLLL